MLEPWLLDAEREMLGWLLSGRMPHAVLLSAQPGMDISELAQRIIAATLCQSPDADGRACGQCKSCQLRSLGHHEDLHVLSTPEDRASIGVEQVRQLCQRLYTTPQRAPRQVAHVRDPEQMTLAASNALLKTLEEPPVRTLLLLETHAMRSLLPTIRSRAVQVQIAPPSLAQSRAWLQRRFADKDAEDLDLALLLSGDAPHAAAQWLENSAWRSLVDRLQRLHAVLFEHGGSVAWLRQERPHVATVRMLLTRLLAPDAQARERCLPTPAQALTRLTHSLNSSSLHRINAELWRAQAQAGSGLREDLQLLEIVTQLRAAMAGT